MEASFSQVVTCYQFQNFTTVTHSFPAEGAYKELPRTFKSPITSTGPFPLKRSGDIRKKVSYALNERSSYPQLFSTPQFSVRPNISTQVLFQNKENIEFDNVDLDEQTLTYLGKFQVVVLQNCLEDLDDPLTFIASLKNIVLEGGFLIISADYNWNTKFDNVSVTFFILEVILLKLINHYLFFQSLDLSDSNSFDLLKRILKDEFEFKEAKNIPEIICESTRSCHIRYNHVTAWMRTSS